MALITFMSDFGNKDHYVASFKAKVLSLDPKADIVDISHNIEHFNIAQGSFILKAVFQDFPEGTVHVSAVDSHSHSTASIALQLMGHYFVGPDNGLFSLVSSHEPQSVVKISPTENGPVTFPAKNLYASIAVKLSQGENIKQLGTPFPDYKTLISRTPRATKKQISGHVIYVDHYGNLITNIEKRDFDILSKNKKFVINFGREFLNKIHNHYSEADPGDCFLVFNDLGLLELGIFRGNASELLGMGYDSPISITFEEG